MVEGVVQEGFFWDTYPWVMSRNSSGGSREGGSEDKNLRDLCMCKNGSQMKQPKTGDMDGLSGGDQEVAATTVGSGSKKTYDVLEVKKENKTEVDAEGSLHNDHKAKREIVPYDHDLHIWTERERRKKMKDMFHQLHALMPQLPEKVPISIQYCNVQGEGEGEDKSAVVDEAISFIKTLQQTLQRLETKKLEMLYGPSSTITTPSQLVQPQRLTRESVLADQGSSTGVSPSSSTSLSFPLCSPKGFQTWVSSNVTLNVSQRDALISICSSPKPGLLTAICFVLEKHKLDIVSAQICSDESKSLFMIHAQANVCDQFMETFHFDEIYKQAATEITHWVNSKSS
ncbi:hypothetical protein L1987_55203 [Smallanthus sonchifolius]|uniref:Uncharacterized protein n=1 Tax=Smallanthus sonchifolius TaxID=185202 RepID=A0ACB9E9P2_9ASTR|nr:hypothetical protein L1987_55203 [Smallanthus sonchifolius]